MKRTDLITALQNFYRSGICDFVWAGKKMDHDTARKCIVYLIDHLSRIQVETIPSETAEKVFDVMFHICFVRFAFAEDTLNILSDNEKKSMDELYQDSAFDVHLRDNDIMRTLSGFGIPYSAYGLFRAFILGAQLVYSKATSYRNAVVMREIGSFSRHLAQTGEYPFHPKSFIVGAQEYRSKIRSLENKIKDLEVQLFSINSNILREKRDREIESLIADAASKYGPYQIEHIADPEPQKTDTIHYFFPDSGKELVLIDVESTVFKNIKNINGDECEIDLKQDLKRDLGFDSLDGIELAINLERVFNTELEGVDVNLFQTVGDIVNTFYCRLDLPHCE